jgi:hypothetical protein
VLEREQAEVRETRNVPLLRANSEDTAHSDTPADQNPLARIPIARHP